MVAEAGPFRFPGEDAESVAADMDEALVVSTFEIEVGDAVQTLIQYDRHAIGRAHRRDRADLAVGEERGHLVFRRQSQPLGQQVLQRAELDPVGAGHDRQDIAELMVDHHGFGHPVAGNMR